MCQFRLKLQNFKQYVCTHTSIDMSETLAALNSSLRPHLAASAVEGGNFSSSCVKEVAYTKVCRRSKVPNLKSYSYKMLPDLRFSRWWLRRVIFSEMWAVGFHRRFGRIYCLHLHGRTVSRENNEHESSGNQSSTHRLILVHCLLHVSSILKMEELCPSKR